MNSSFASVISSKSFFAVYQCPSPTSSMNIGVGRNMSGGAFGICQSNNLLYSPYQYAVGDLTYAPTNYTDVKYAFASFDASTNIISGIPGFNDLSLQAVAYQNKAFNTPFYLGSSSELYTSSAFHLCELVATSNAVSSSDRQDVEAYLANKWGLTLPVGHPYKDFQPSGDQWIPIGLPTTVSGLMSWLDMTIAGQTGTNIADRAGGSFTLVGNPLSLSNINNHPSLYFPGSGNAYLRSRMGAYPPVGSALFVFNIADTRRNLPIITFGGNPLLVYTAPILTIQNDDETGKVSVNLPAGNNLVFFAWGDDKYYMSVNGGTPLVGPPDAKIASPTSFYI
jgi:hypothetical protein